MIHSSKEHWDNVFSTNIEEQLSWFQPYPKTSMEFVQLFDLPLDANIIDVGGGDSHFVDALLERGYQNIWVLDISTNAVERAKKRLGRNASKIHWIVSDMLDYNPGVKFDLWHDRAAFHFLTSEDSIYQYVHVAENAIKENGYLILGTFSENGPERCSGLEIRRYSETSMSARFEISFERIKCIEENHITPFHRSQNFLFCSFKRR